MPLSDLRRLFSWNCEDKGEQLGSVIRVFSRLCLIGIERAENVSFHDTNRIYIIKKNYQRK